MITLQDDLEYPGRSLLVPRPKSSLVHCRSPSLSSTVQGSATFVFKFKIKTIIETLSYLLSSNGSHVCGLAEEVLLPAAGLVDHQHGNSQCRQHLVGLTHVVTGEVGECLTLILLLRSLLSPFLTVGLFTCGANVHDSVRQNFFLLHRRQFAICFCDSAIKVDQVRDSQIEIMKAWGHPVEMGRIH